MATAGRLPLPHVLLLGLLLAFGVVGLRLAIVPHQVDLHCNHVRPGVAHCVINRFSVFETMTRVEPEVQGTQVSEAGSRSRGYVRTLFLATPDGKSRPISEDFSPGEHVLRRMEASVSEVREGTKARISERAADPLHGPLMVIALVVAAAIGVWFYWAVRHGRVSPAWE